MNSSSRSFRSISLAVTLFVTLGVAGLASAKSSPTSLALQATATMAATATPIDPDQPVPVTMGQAATSPLDADNIPHRYFEFKGKANEAVNVTVSVLTGNMAFKLYVNDQSGTEIGYTEGTFVTSATLGLKLPMDGNYQIQVNKANPGSGDFAAGTISVVVSDATAAAPSVAATPAATPAK